TKSSVPAMKLASEEARKSTALATSPGSPDAPWWTLCNRRSGVPAENQIGGSARNHVGRRVRRPRNDPWHHRCVGHPQAQKSVHPQLWVDNRELIHAHLAGAHGMSKARR